jgi:hypothetical protein
MQNKHSKLRTLSGPHPSAHIPLAKHSSLGLTQLPKGWELVSWWIVKSQLRNIVFKESQQMCPTVIHMKKNMTMSLLSMFSKLFFTIHEIKQN